MMYPAVLASALAVALPPPAPPGPPPAPPGPPAGRSDPDPPRKQLSATRIQSAPTIDGDLGDPAWSEAQLTDDFRQRDPVEGAAPSRRTEVGFVYDDEALYVVARMYARGRSDVRTVMTRRDVSDGAERIIISIDTLGDRRTAYTFAVTAAGVKVDWYHPEDHPYTRDSSFDPVWDAATRVDDTGWTAEMRIPFSQLRFTGGSQQVWGVNLNRYMPQSDEDVFWVVVPREEMAWASRFGDLVGISNIKTPRRLEIMPYVAGETTVTSSSLIAPGDPFAQEVGIGGRLGIDMKMGLGPSLTLDATANPDFGQVEADPAVVNLTAFETVYDERRPFFIEGQKLLAGAGARYFYSRRIGARPPGNVTGDPDYVDTPSSTRILAATKVTGRFRRGTSIGALAALTDRVHARTRSEDAEEIARQQIAPLATYGVVRLQQEIGPNASVIGLSLTDVARHNMPAQLASQLPDHAIAGGGDWDLRFQDGTYRIEGHAGFSAVHGRPEAIARIQTSSAHDLQRPDQSHVSFDPTRTTLAGWTAALGASKEHGSWLWELATSAISPGFEINDAGQMQRADQLAASGGIEFQQTTPGDWFNSWKLGVEGNQQWTFGEHRKLGFAELEAELVWRNLWRSEFEAGLILPGLSDTLTRGGPLMGIGGGWFVEAGLQNSFGSRNRFDIATHHRHHPTGETGTYAEATVTFRPADRWRLTVGPRAHWAENTRQYVDTIAGGSDATFGQRYIFATVTRREISTQVRLQLAVTPDLAVELYGEPFAASGLYTWFGELPAPRSKELRLYGTEGTTIARSEDGYVIDDGGESFALRNPDFNYLSLRSTLVLRWELLPGSVLFLVWQQDRSETARESRSAGLGRWADSFSTPGRNVFAVKLSYWWPAG